MHDPTSPTMEDSERSKRRIANIMTEFLIASSANHAETVAASAKSPDQAKLLVSGLLQKHLKRPQTVVQYI